VTELENYITQGEPEQKERGYLWDTAIGLQQVDGLKPSDYLIATANENINIYEGGGTLFGPLWNRSLTLPI
jgi:hypothetical protein